MFVQILLVLLPVLLVIFIFVVGISWYIAHTSLVPPKTPNSKTPADLDLDYEAFTLNRSGHSLHGWYILAPPERLTNGQDVPTIIMTHGWGSNAQQMLPSALFLHQAGFNVILFDIRGHGDNEPLELISMKEVVEDLRSLINFALEHAKSKTMRIGLFGHSMGAAVSILAASQDDRVQAVVSSSGFADFAHLTAQMLRWRRLPAFPFRYLIQNFWERWLGSLMSEINPVDHIGNISIPVLLLHGEEDRVVTPDQADKLYQKAQRAEKCLLAGKNHADLVEDPRYAEEVVAFFDRTLRMSEVKSA